MEKVNGKIDVASDKTWYGYVSGLTGDASVRSSGAVAAASLHTDNTGQNVNHVLSGNGHVPNMLGQVNQVVFQFAFYLGPANNTKKQILVINMYYLGKYFSFMLLENIFWPQTKDFKIQQLTIRRD